MDVEGGGRFHNFFKMNDGRKSPAFYEDRDRRDYVVDRDGCEEECTGVGKTYAVAGDDCWCSDDWDGEHGVAERGRWETATKTADGSAAVYATGKTPRSVYDDGQVSTRRREKVAGQATTHGQERVRRAHESFGMYKDRNNVPWCAKVPNSVLSIAEPAPQARRMRRRIVRICFGQRCSRRTGRSLRPVHEPV